MSTTPRRAAWSDESMQESNGTFKVVACQEDRPGYWTLSPGWPTLEAARDYATEVNQQQGLSQADALEVRMSSMAAHNTGWRVSDDQVLYGDEEVTQ